MINEIVRLLGLKYMWVCICTIQNEKQLLDGCEFFSNFLFQLSSTKTNNLHALFYVMIVFYKLLFSPCYKCENQPSESPFILPKLVGC